MARLFSLFARGPAPPLADAPPPPGAGTPVPPPAALRRERDELLRRREVGVRDLGGLLLEMVRRDRFRSELLIERAERVVAIEHRINELDSLLASSAAAGRHLRRVPRCECGAPLPPGVHFCSHCGRPAKASPPSSVCDHCGRPLAADANFCAFCGNAVAADLPEEPVEATMAAPPHDGEPS